ncbi:eukaryotic translation initiation factor 2 [Homalodisca vitripennis]|nr:eukaryotic translation initiation factor 2 [Homalodisca vitripennis]
MRDKNPDMVAGKKQKFVMRPPQVVRIGTKKTSFANFTEICKTLHRQPKHLLDFLLAELGTSGSVDGNSQLIIKGRFQQKQIENVLRRYIKEYVTCHTCRSPDTILQKDTRLFFLQCETCGSRCSVASIKSGFQVWINVSENLANGDQSWRDLIVYQIKLNGLLEQSLAGRRQRAAATIAKNSTSSQPTVVCHSPGDVVVFGGVLNGSHLLPVVAVDC